jgi:undecaprenyl-diphosphatase
VNDYLVSVILGIVEGLTEFLPVSSTAHLRICEDWLNISLKSEYWKMYSVVIQLGAILSVVFYFWRRIVRFLRTFPSGETGNLNVFTHPLSLVAIAFIVTAGPSYLLDKKIGQILERLDIMAGALIVGGIIMWVVDRHYTHPRIQRMEEMGPLRATWIGAMQVLSAVFPGTSRSMATIAAGQVVEMSRPAALEFSFFLSIPTMLAATLYKLKGAIFPKTVAAHIAMDAHRWIVLGIGFFVSFAVALLVVAWFMNWVRRRGFVPFAVYRILFGTALLCWIVWNGAR